MGSNIGVQVRKLFEPTRYHGAPVLKIFNSVFGKVEQRVRPSSQSGLCAFGFEASPVHQERLEKVQSVYQSNGWRVKFFVPRAVSISDNEKITLNLNSKHNLGASAVWSRGDSKSEGRGSVEVQTLDLPTFVATEIRPRVWKPTLPEVKPYVLMKMDIEGSEYIVLPKMLERGLLCQGIIDMIFIEWHPSYVPNGKNLTKQLRARLRDQNRCHPGTPTLVSAIDDETYNRDDRSLP